jgi:hypothetical protein
MDFKKLIADLAARYRKVSEPIFSSSLAPPGQVVDVDAAHEAGRKAGYEAGYKKGYDEGSVSHETYTNTPQTTCATSETSKLPTVAHKIFRSRRIGAGRERLIEVTLEVEKKIESSCVRSRRS